MWPFRKKPPSTPVAAVFGLGPGSFHQHFEQKVQPDIGGASIFAYESLALVPMSPIGAGVTLHDFIRPVGTDTPSYYDYSVKTVGLPTQAGTIYGQALFDPNNPDANSLPVQNVSPLVHFNLPITRAKPIATNSPFPQDMRGAL